MKEKITQEYIDQLLLNTQRTAENNQNNIPSDNAIISLSMKIISSNKEYFQVEIMLKNLSNDDLIVFYSIPIEEKIILKNKETSEEFSPVLPILASGTNSGIVLTKRSKIKLKLGKIHYDFNKNIDINEFLIALPIGKYNGSLILHFDSSFFCPFSHLRYNDCKSIAYSKNKKLWEGTIKSNIVEFEKYA